MRIFILISMIIVAGVAVGLPSEADAELPPMFFDSRLGAAAAAAAQQTQMIRMQREAQERQWREESYRRRQDAIRQYSWEADGIKTPSVLQTNCHLHSVTCLERLRGR